LDIYLFLFLSAKKKKKKKCPNNKKEIYNDKYKHTRDRLFGLPEEQKAANMFILLLHQTDLA
jgi:hypothetical protein